MLTVIVTGGRTFCAVDTVWRELNAAHKRSPIALVVTGGASGADALAAAWARSQGLQTRKVPGSVGTLWEARRAAQERADAGGASRRRGDRLPRRERHG